MRSLLLLPLLACIAIAGGVPSAGAASKGQALAAATPRIVGGTATARLPMCRTTVRYDAKMVRAARIAQSQARSHSVKRCWRFVKRALLAADVVESYPKTTLAKQAASELPQRYGFRRIPVRDPFQAPVGSVLVYGGRGAGHVEIRTERGFVSDFASRTPSPRPLVGVFVKPPSAEG